MNNLHVGRQNAIANHALELATEPWTIARYLQVDVHGLPYILKMHIKP